MARASKITPYNNFIGGLITEAIELNQPPKSTTDEDNCLLLSDGERIRRRGAVLEDGYALSTPAVNAGVFLGYAVNTFTWKAVGGIGNTNFSVIQFGNTLSFHSISGNSLSAGIKSFTINLNSYLAPGVTNAASLECEFTSGKGALFVVSKGINPFYVTYNSTTDSITVTPITIQIRDFEGIDDGVAVTTEPLTLTTTHHYNLLNRGWQPTPANQNPITDYFADASKYPPKNIQWFQFKKTGSGAPVDTTLAREYQAGNTSAPQGHFIVDAFNIDRNAVSGLTGLAVDSVNSRPTTVAFFAGRVWYAGVEGQSRNSNVYFSQVLTALNKSGHCYQEEDPASENDPAPVDSDGGVAVIPDIGVVRKLVSLKSMLIVIASNGVWAIRGVDSNFKATDFFIEKIGDDGCLNTKSVVMGAGVPIWWGEAGIFTIQQDEVSTTFSIQNLTETTIQRFYDDIPQSSKTFAKGAYDDVNRRIVWFYKSAENASGNYRYNRAIWLDLRLQAFYPWTVASLPSNSPYVASIVETPTISRLTEEDPLTTIGGATVTTVALVPITVEVTSIISLLSTLKYLTVVPSGGNVQYTFSDFRETNFSDWSTPTVAGANYRSYAVTWWELNDDGVRNVQAPYIYVYLRRTETAFAVNAEGGYDLVSPSGLYLTALWDFANTSASHRISRTTQVYRLKQNVIPNIVNLSLDTGYPIVVTRTKIRGKGKALQLRFDSEDGKDFNLYGWSVVYSGNTLV